MSRKPKKAPARKPGPVRTTFTARSSNYIYKFTESKDSYTIGLDNDLEAFDMAKVNPDVLLVENVSLNTVVCERPAFPKLLAQAFSKDSGNGQAVALAPI